MSKFDMTEKVRSLIQDEVNDLLAQNIDAITTELYENTEGKLNVSLSVKLKAVKDRVHATTTLAYSRKFSDEVDDSVAVDNPDQIKLPLEEPAVESGDAQ